MRFLLATNERIFMNISVANTYIKEITIEDVIFPSSGQVSNHRFDEVVKTTSFSTSSQPYAP